MARGRKKGGLKINGLSNSKEIQDMIINQINSLNKKVKAFKNKGVEEYEDYYKTILNNGLVDFTNSGTISKSKKQFENKSMVILKKTLSSLHKINNNEMYGTIKKYEKEVTQGLKKVQEYSKDYFSNKGYSNNFINDITSDKGFYAMLYSAFNENNRNIGSDQIIEKIALEYNAEGSGLEEKEVDRILSNIEYSKNVLDRLKDEQDMFDEWKRNNGLR